MTAAVAVLGVLVAVLILLVVALLRSHAEILRRMAALEVALDTRESAPPVAAGVPEPAADASAGGFAADISGETLQGDAVRLSLADGAPPTLLAFLGTGCAACVPLWEQLRGGAVPTPAGARLVVITRGPERERIARLLELAPARAEVVMSTPAWEDYTIPSTPHFVLVRDGQVAGRGAATSWEQISGFLVDADADDRVYASRRGGLAAPLSTEARAARAESALAQAGIGPGHASLHPARGDADE